MYFNIDTKLYGNQIDLDKGFRSMYFKIGQKSNLCNLIKKGNMNNV